MFSTRVAGGSVRISVALLTVLVTAFAVLASPGAFAQTTIIDPAERGSHEEFFELVESAGANTLTEALRRYEALPPSAIAGAEKCRLLWRVYLVTIESEDWDEYEAFEECAQKLIETYPDAPDAKLVYVKVTDYHEREAYLQSLVEEVEENPEEWAGLPVWELYQNLAGYASSSDRQLEFALLSKALAANDTLDLAVRRGRAMLELNLKQSALSILLADSLIRRPSASRANAAMLFFDLGRPDTAAAILRTLRGDSSIYYDQRKAGEIFLAVGDTTSAREAFRESADGFFGMAGAVSLFRYELEFGSRDSATQAYRELRAFGYDADVLSAHRMALFFRHPTAPWNWTDLLGILILLAAIGCCFVAPYLWVLPVDYTTRRWTKSTPDGLPTFPWTLRHAWLGTSAFLIAVTLVVVGRLDEIVSDELAAVHEAQWLLVFGTILAIGTFLVAGRGWLKLVTGGAYDMMGRLAVAGAALFAFIVAFVLVRTLIAYVTGTVGVAIRPDIAAMVETYGWFASVLFIGVFVPVYEEILFRGILMGALDKRLPFWVANVGQALIFGAIHFDLSTFVYLTALALVIGWVTRKTQSLLPAMMMHALNNIFVLGLIALAQWIQSAG